MTKAVFPMDHGDWKVDWDEYINEYLQFKHPSIEQQYLQMRIQRAYSRHHRQHSYWMIGLSCIVLLTLWTIFINAWLIFESNSHKPAHLIFNAIAIIFAILTALVTSRLLCSSSSIPFPLLSPAPIQPTRSPPLSVTKNNSNNNNNNDDFTPMTSTRTTTTTLPSSFTYLQRIRQYQILFFLLINVQVLMNYINFILDISSCNYNKDTPCFSSNMKVSIIQGTSLLPFLLTFLLYDENLFVILISISNLLIIYLTFGTWWSFFPKLLIALILLFMKLEYRKLRIESFLIHLTYLKIVKEHEKRESKEVRATIGNITHDLRTPITAFSLGIENLLEICSRLKANVSSSLYNPLAESIKNLQSTNASLLMTFNRCIDYTKASKGMKLVPKYETVDLREALQFPIECMSNIQERIGIKLEAMSEEICSHIITDKQWLQENLLCLLSNAVKYSPDNCEVAVRVSLEEYEHSMLLPSEDNSSSVTLLPQCHVDSNPNIEVSQTELFHQNTRPMTISHRRYRFLQIEVADFSTTTLSEKDIQMFFSDPQQLQRMAGGTGIGLYTLGRRLEALQGYWGASKQKDGLNGNIFWFAIPFEPYQGRKFKEKVKPRLDVNHDVVVSISETEHDSSKVTRDEMDVLSLLVVDDSPAILKMSSMMLKRQGHQIWTAENGEIALKRIEEKWRGSGKGFDLVLMDLQMPVMDGLEATRRLRAMESEGREWMDKDCRQLVFGVSATSDEATTAQSKEVGMDEFLPKPFSFEDLLDRYRLATCACSERL